MIEVSQILGVGRQAIVGESFVRQADGHWDEGTSYGPSETAESVMLPGIRLALPDLRAEMGIKD